MFGNVVPAAEALSCDDKELFQSFYCSLCREIGKISQFARLGLSYDMTFLAILLSSVGGFETGDKKRCIIHPSRRFNDISASGIQYAAEISVLLIKAKLRDDAADEKNPIFLLASALIRYKGNSEKNDFIKKCLCDLADVEAKNILNPDMAADCFAALCANLFTPDYISDESVTKILYWLGYNIGRWTYLLDAYDDLEHDLKKGCYNPFASSGNAADLYAKISSDTEQLLYFTLSEAAAAFDLLPVTQCRSLLENIIYQGLAARQNSVFASHKKGTGV